MQGRFCELHPFSFTDRLRAIQHRNTGQDRNTGMMKKKQAGYLKLIGLIFGAALFIHVLSQFVDDAALDHLKHNLSLWSIIALVIIINLVSFICFIVMINLYKWISRDFKSPKDDIDRDL